MVFVVGEDCMSICCAVLLRACAGRHACVYPWCDVLAGGSGRANHQDARAVHSLLKDTIHDDKAAAQWFSRCQSVFCWSQYFAGSKRSQFKADPDQNGLVEAGVAQLSLNGHA